MTLVSLAHITKENMKLNKSEKKPMNMKNVNWRAKDCSCHLMHP